MFVSRLVRWLGCGLAAFAELLREGIRFVLTIACSRAALGAEVLFLRKQLVYREHKIRPRRLTAAARLKVLLLSGFFACKESLAIVTPETFIRWHRKGFKFYWRWNSRGGRPALPKEIRQLIIRMVKENITWGEERIADELFLKLGKEFVWIESLTNTRAGAKGECVLRTADRDGMTRVPRLYDSAE